MVVYPYRDAPLGLQATHIPFNLQTFWLFSGAGSLGGRGSWNPIDRSMFGDRQSNEGLDAKLWKKVDGVWVPRSLNTGKLTDDPNYFWRTAQPGDGTYVVYPGGGGGAKLPGKRKYGSRAPGYSANGAVLIRLRRVE